MYGIAYQLTNNILYFQCIKSKIIVQVVIKLNPDKHTITSNLIFKISVHYRSILSRNLKHLKLYIYEHRFFFVFVTFPNNEQ